MSEQLMRYYERELAYVRRALADFGQRFPGHANRLQLDQGSVDDPNIARLIDGMALLTAKTEQRLDQQLPGLLEGLFSVLYPGYTEIIPSYCALTLLPDPKQLNKTIRLPAASPLSVAMADGSRCRFSTADELTIHPIVLDSVTAEAAPFSGPVPADIHQAGAVIHLQLACATPELRFSQLAIDDLDFYVRGFEHKADSLIELLLSETRAIVVSDRQGQQYQTLAGERMSSRIADPSFQWLPRYGNQFAGFDLLRDYFAYPDKGAYFRIQGLGEALRQFKDHTVTLSLFVRQLPAEYIRLFDASVFSLHTVPAINRFRQPGEPLHYDFSQLSVPVVADASADVNLEVISVEAVREIHPTGERTLCPLFHSSYRQPDELRQWQLSQRWDELHQRQLMLTIGCPGCEWPELGSIILALDLCCCNGHAPCQIPLDTAVESLAPIDLPGTLSVQSIPTPPRYPALDDSLAWRFIALLNANFASLLQTERPLQALQEVLSLCNPGAACPQAEAIRAVSYQQQVASMAFGRENLFSVGTAVTITLDSKRLGGPSALLSEVLNGFYQQFCSFDRFIQVTVRHYGDDRGYRVFPAVHGSQLCL